MHYVKRLMRDVMCHGGLYTVSVIATAGYLLLDVFLRNQMGVVTDNVLTGSSQFYWQLALLLGASLGAAPFHGLSTYSKALMSQRVMRDLRVRVGEKTTRIETQSLLRQHSGDIIARIGSELRALDNFVYYGLSVVTTLVVQSTSTLLVMLGIDWQLSLVVIAATGITMWLNFLSTRQIGENHYKYQKAMGQATHLAQESFSSMEAVKSFHMEGHMQGRYDRVVDDATLLANKNNRLLNQSTALGKLLGQVPMFLALVFGAFKVADGSMSVGQLMSIATVSSSFCIILGGMPADLLYLRRSQAASKRIYEFLDLPDERSGNKAKPEGANKNLVYQLRDVVFSYQQESPVLSGVNLQVHQGETLALVGESGGGKSTVLRLLSALLLPESGSVQCYGLSTAEWSTEKLRQQIAWVAQDAALFPGTIRDNLCAGLEEVSDERVLTACDHAGIGAFVRQRGLDEQVGEWGAKVSGGQRQRLAIARAFVKNAPILILDEPTAALDPESEAAVMDGLMALMKGRTTVMVTHRNALLSLADRVMLIQNGAAQEAGGQK